MSIVGPGLCALLLAAGGAWSAWSVTGYRPVDVSAAGLGLAVASSFAAYMVTDRKDAALWLRFGLYGGTLAVAAASLWTGAVQAASGRALARRRHGLVRGAGRSVAGHVRRAGSGRRPALRALVRGGGGGSQAPARRRAPAPGRVRPARPCAASRAPLPAKTGQTPRYSARPVGRASGRPAHRLVARRLRHHRGPAARGQGRHHRPQSALARTSRFRGVHGHHRPARRALVHRRQAPPRARPPRAAPRSLRGGGEAQGGFCGMSPAGREERHLQPAGVHPRGRGPRRARHQRAARRPAHTAPSGRPRKQPAFLRIRPRHRRRLHGVGALQGAAEEALAQDAAQDAVGVAGGAGGLCGGLQEGGALRWRAQPHRGRAPGPGRQGGRRLQLHHRRQPARLPQLPRADRQHGRRRASIR